MLLQEVLSVLGINENATCEEIKCISIDSRNIRTGDLYIPIKGENFDGHDFIDDAIKNGASAALSEHSTSTLNIYQVDNTKLALGILAKHHREKNNPKVIALTGSVGKTTLKEYIFNICKQAGKSMATIGNLNNELGVPLSLLRIQPEHEYCVFELGANHPGELAYTSSLVSPDVSIINNIASAHEEGFGSLQGVCSAKSEIFLGLSKSGIAIVNGDDYFFEQMSSAAKDHKTFTFGLSKKFDIYAENITSGDMGLFTFDLIHLKQKISIRLPLPGKHNVMNALAAAASCLSIGITMESIKLGLESTTPINGRLKSMLHESGTQFIDDTYNANPKSMLAAIDYLSTLPGRKILVLGGMGELGPNSKKYHKEVCSSAIDANIDEICTLGPMYNEANIGHSKRCHFDVQSDLISHLGSRLQPNLHILIKGSRANKMENILKSFFP